MSYQLPSALQEFIHKSRYARYIDSKQRRETWEETVTRYIDFATEHIGEKHNNGLEAWNDVKDRIKDGILTLKIMPSMRLLMTAGEAVKRDNISAYNCFYTAIDKKRRFADILHILLNGTGAGFSCERQEIVKLPTVADKVEKSDDTIVVQDSKKGWSTAYKKLISALYNGEIPKIDYSKVRPAGQRLKVFGGRSSGPAPLKELFDFTIDTFKNSVGRKLTSIEVHDLCCKIAEVVVVGGVRRSALISLSNLSDRRMREAKSGAWWEDNPQRALANNSAVYTEKPDMETFMEEWLSLVKSKSGERGIFSRVAAQKQAAKWGKRDPDAAYGCNPCSEILLLPSGEMCNLTEVVVRAEDTFETLKEKVELCTILGTFQSTLTNFDFVDPQIKENCEKERLLGVSMTGVMDHKVLNTVSEEAKTWLHELREFSVSVNSEWADKFEVNRSVAITCNKPSGTVGQLTNVGTGGLHPRFSQYYIRTVRQDNKDPLTNFLKSQGVYSEPDVMKPDSTTVFSFPVKGPKDAVFRDDRTAIEQLEHWMMYQRHWCHHKPSITIYVKEHEWMAVGDWVYSNFDEVSGVSFLPFSEHTYRQAPFQVITEEEFLEWDAKTPKNIDWESFVEMDDQTVSSQELACTGGTCSI
jgi:ribonucleoside-diphosphate reductase alpha chain